MKLSIRNFRSIKEQEIDLAPITVVYGPNGAGKSSLLYALLALKNISLNPNQAISSFFNFGFANLGSYEGVVFDHQTDKNIDLMLALEQDDRTLAYGISLSESSGTFKLEFGLPGSSLAQLVLPVSFPYPANQQAQTSSALNETSMDIVWNGITAQVQTPTHDLQETANQMASFLNLAVETLRRVNFVPLKRGFSKPQYSAVSVSPLMVTEDEVAAFISNNKYLVSKISLYLERILQRDLRVNVTPGTAIFSLDATDRETGVSSELVNEGFGINQIVYFLARCLYRDAGLVCVEEPEIHLHPSAVRGLAHALAQIVVEEDKRFIISTHSESFILALLAMVANGKLKPDNIACYLARKERKTTSFERQLVNAQGQIQGGLSNFMRGELEDLQTFMNVAS